MKKNFTLDECVDEFDRRHDRGIKINWVDVIWNSDMQTQNRLQKVFNRRAYVCAGGLALKIW